MKTLLFSHTRFVIQPCFTIFNIRFSTGNTLQDEVMEINRDIYKISRLKFLLKLSYVFGPHILPIINFVSTFFNESSCYFSDNKNNRFWIYFWQEIMETKPFTTVLQYFQAESQHRVQKRPFPEFLPLLVSLSPQFDLFLRIC